MKNELCNDKVLIIGESCKDVFNYCDAKRLCPDIPVPALTVKYQKDNPGMAMNVYRNLKKYIPNCDIITNSDWEVITKTRYMDEKSNHMFIRVDSENTKEKFDINKFNKIKNNYKLIVISDYNKGFLSEKDIQNISSSNITVFIDTKKIIGKWAKNIDIIKINNYEYNNSLNYINKNAWLKEKIIHTVGEDGCYYKGIHFPVKKAEIKDSSGAGDTFFAGLIIEYLNTNDMTKSIKFANKCASKVVQEKGVTTL